MNINQSQQLEILCKDKITKNLLPMIMIMMIVQSIVLVIILEDFDIKAVMQL